MEREAFIAAAVRGQAGGDDGAVLTGDAARNFMIGQAGGG